MSYSRRTKPLETCKVFLLTLRKQLKVPSRDRIDKRYGNDTLGYLAPDDCYWVGHCRHCAEVEYLLNKYSSSESSGVVVSKDSTSLGKIILEAEKQ